jgi:hypothetical protein
MRSRSCEDLLEPCVTTPSDDQDAAISDRPSDCAADPGLTSEPRVSVPHGSLERERQLITSSPALHVHELVPLQPAERNRSGASSLTSATGERDDRDRDRRAATLELLPHRLVAHQLTAPRNQPSRMRPTSPTTRRRLARIARRRLAGRTRPHQPATRHMQSLRRSRALSRVAMLPTAGAGRRSTVRAPLI